MKKLYVIILLIISMLSLSGCEDETILDEIESYTITVDPLSDGTLNMKYEILWKVLNSDSEGPLEWVKIGVPNKYVDKVEATSSAVKKAYFYSDDGSYIRADLDKSYYKGQTVNISFSFHQSRIFTYDDDYIYYRFTPGWFTSIEIKKLTVKWNSSNVNYSNTNNDLNSYLIWEASLNKNESINCDVNYLKSAFPNIDLSKDYSNDDGNTVWVIFLVCGIILGFAVLIFVIARLSSDDYYFYRGFSGQSYYRYRFFPWYYRGYRRNGSRTKDPTIVKPTGGGRHGSSCACACACAGGGRAGCSRKDFYNNFLEIDKLSKNLKK